MRKIRSNLPALAALEATSRCGRGSTQDPGCVLIPRMKDGRITIARPGGPAGGTRKIHPHLALVQIFKDPAAVNHNHLVAGSQCTAPFFARPEQAGEPAGEMVCISPMHYSMDTRPQPGKALGNSPKKRPTGSPGSQVCWQTLKA